MDSRSGRITQGQYWMYFGGFIVVGAALIFGAIVSVMSFNVTLALGLFILLGAVGIYFRVIQMRRCRDIGWPAFLPWLFFGASMALGAMNGGITARRLADPSALLASSGIMLLIGLADFIFMIVIGCIASTNRFTPAMAYETFGPDETAPRFATPVAYPNAAPAMNRKQALRANLDALENPDTGQFDDIIARAVSNYQRSGSAIAAQPTPVASTAYAPQPRGFGRKGG